MSDEPENLVLVYLRRFDGRFDRVDETLREIKIRQNDMARQLAGFRREQGTDAETIAHVQAQLDSVREELDRIKRRLDLRDA